MNFKTIARLLLGFTGAVFALFALLAYQLGLDKNTAWGASRVALLAFGLVLLLGCFREEIRKFLAPGLERVISFWRSKVVRHSRNFTERAKSRWAFQTTQKMRSSRAAQTASRMSKQSGPLLSLVVLIGIGVFYLWVITSGQWTVWPTEMSYYDKLSDALAHGQLYLIEEPSTELLALADPYDLKTRLDSGASYLPDASLYRGKYFVYWGPVPALFFWVIKSFKEVALNDAFLVIGFLVALTLCMRFLWDGMRKRFLQPVSGGELFLFSLTTSVVIPIPYLLARPGTYEASIAGGQFFLMGALVCIFLAFKKKERIQKKWLALASSAIILAAGTRVSLSFSLVFLSFMVALYLLGQQKGLRERLTNLFIFLVPQGLGAGLLLLYNLLRFDSPWEFGMRYALSVTHMPDTAPHFLNFANILPNLFIYLFRLPEVSGEFPFLSVSWVDASAWPFFIKLPPFYYYSEPAAGLLFLSPVTVFVMIVFYKVFRHLSVLKNRKVSMMFVYEQRDAFQTWWLFTLCGTVAISFITVLLFFAATMRYMMDFIPLLVLLAFSGGSMWARESPTDNIPPRGRRVLFVAACWVTIVSGLLLSMSGPNNHLLNKNPVLYEKLGSFLQSLIGP
ncbi:MAG: hypothetical protein IT308_02075 [Anaerolineaceae bacterium]|nr:hypothetical protein [Anaerolineaceae bacterium]